MNDSAFRYYDDPTLQVDLVAQAIVLSDEKMFVSPDGERVYFLSSQPGIILIRFDSVDQANYNLMTPEEIREHVKFRLREAGMENDIDYQGPQVS